MVISKGDNYMKYDFNKVIDRKNTNSVKWDLCCQIFGKSDILPMWVADMDFSSPVEIIDAIKKRAEHGIFGYTFSPDRLGESIVRWMKKRHNWDIKEEWILHTPGVVTSVKNAILALTEKGDGVLLQTPVYYPFFASITGNGRKLITNPLIYNNGYYEIDFDDLETKFSGGVKMMILCSPHNPGGRVWRRYELEKIAELAEKHKVIILSDEIHSDLVFKDYKHIPVASLSKETERNTLTCISPTKTFNIASLSHSSVIIPNPEFREKFEKTGRNTGADMLNIFGQIAAEAAYTYGEEWLDELMEYLGGNLETLNTYFKDNIPSIRVGKLEATYLAWLDCRDVMDKAGNLNRFLVEKAGVGLNDGAMYGREGFGFQRLNFACPRGILLEGLKRIGEAINSL